MPEPQKPASLAAPLGWAAFLGASWTWCIGMYLPILMVRDLGLAGYLVFAVPNVVGAAAMGWVLGSPESSLRLTTDHRAACQWFSIVTRGYHVYWACWLLFWAVPRLGMPAWLFAAAIIAAVLAGALRSILKLDGLTRIASLCTMGVSLVAMGVWLATYSQSTPNIGQTLAATAGQTGDALWMLPVSSLGFALCPYLDLTFHRARQACQTPSASRLAFGVGFGVCFALMIVFTLIYAGPMVLTVDGSGNWPTIPAIAAAALGVHVLVQWVFTVAAHGHEIRGGPSVYGRAAAGVGGFAVLAGVLAAMFAHVRPFDMAIGEIGYRLFLSFYGLVFPAYVWINVIDVHRRSMRQATRRSLRVTAAAIALASPFYFVGFMMREEPWLVPGFAIVILAKLAAGPAAEARPEPSA